MLLISSEHILNSTRIIFCQVMFIVLTFSGCAGELQTKISHGFAKLSPGTTVAILPVEITEKDQESAAKLFRQNLYANLEQTKFHVMERYMVDSLLHQNKISNPQRLKEVSAIDLGEILGADAVIQSTMTKMDRTYAVVHSSIELGVSIKMTDTRSGEILWIADQTDNDYDGIAKIPTGITSAALAPVQFITNKVNLHHLTQKMTEKLIAPLKDPNSTPEEEIFHTPIIATSSAREIEKISSHPQRLTTETTAQPSRSTKERQTPSSKRMLELSKSIEEETFHTPIIATSAPREIEKISSHPQRLTAKTTTQLSRSIKQRQTPSSKKILELPESIKLFTVQVGAYKSKARAKEMISALSTKGYRVYLYPTGKANSEIFKVRVEKFKTREEAIRYGLTLGRKEKLDQFVTHFSR